MIESTSDSERTALHVPAELLSAIAVQCAIRVDEDLRRAAFHHLAFGAIPASRVDPMPTRTESWLLSGLHAFCPRHDSALRRLRLRQVEVSAQDARRRGVGHNSQNCFQHLDLLPLVRRA